MTFEECVMHCFEERELVREFNRLWGCSLGVDQRPPIERMIDQATGHEPSINEAEAVRFIDFVLECIWLPLVDQAHASDSP